MWTCRRCGEPQGDPCVECWSLSLGGRPEVAVEDLMGQVFF